MEKLKELWKKLNPRVAIVGGVVVVSTTLGTCHLLGEEEAPKTEEAALEEAPAEEKPAEAPQPEATEE
jgi:hypothetical protein